MAYQVIFNHLIVFCIREVFIPTDIVCVITDREIHTLEIGNPGFKGPRNFFNNLNL